LILDLSEDGKFVTVTAFKAHPPIEAPALLRELRAEIPNVEIQIFDGAHLAGKEHLEIAAISAVHAFKLGNNISRSMAMETLLYASAQRQIDVALDKLGVTPSSQTVALVMFSETRDGAQELENKIARFVKAETNDAVLNEWPEEKTSEIMALYGITQSELEAIRMPGQGLVEAIRKAVIERVALLSTRT